MYVRMYAYLIYSYVYIIRVLVTSYERETASLK